MVEDFCFIRVYVRRDEMGMKAGEKRGSYTVEEKRLHALQVVHGA